ncbi:MAG: hypothetical protein WC556_14245, partial [Candidatus Methanoperedens sp.]
NNSFPLLQGLKKRILRDSDVSVLAGYIMRNAKDKTNGHFHTSPFGVHLFYTLFLKDSYRKINII